MGAMALDGLDRAAVADHVVDLRMRGFSETTIVLRVRVLGILAGRVAPTPLLQVTPAEMKRWQRSLMGSGPGGAPLMPETRRTYGSQVREFYKWALAEGLIESDPATVLVGVKVSRGRPKPMPEDDLELALASARPMMRAWLTLAAGAGLRAMEIAGLERADVVETAAVPHLVIRGKGSKTRMVPLAPWVLAELERYGMPAEGPLFRMSDGRQATPRGVSNLSGRFLRGQGIQLSIHKCRHRFATALYKATRDLRLVQEALGHESPSTTIRYADYDHDQTASAVAGLTVGGVR